MNTSASTHPFVRFLMRRYVEVLAALAVLFVLQTGLVPFDFKTVGDATGSITFLTTIGDRLTFPDVVSNIFLYLPLGVLLHWSLCLHVRRGIPVWPIVIVAAAAMSLGIEWIQAYSPVRVSSLIDWVANVIGATLGAAMSSLVRRIFPRMVGAALVEFHLRPQSALVKVYCLLLVVFAAAPFSLSFDGTRLKQAVQSATFVPFGAIPQDNILIEEALAESNDHVYAEVHWRKMKRWSRWVTECAAFALLAWLLQPVLRGEYRFGRSAAMALSFYLGGLMAIGLSAVQLVIVSRDCDVTDILFRVLGLGAGLLMRSVYLRDSHGLTPMGQERRGRSLARVGCLATAGYILYTGLIPLTLDPAAGGVSASITSEGFLPFFAYFMARFDLMMADVMEKFSSYVVFAALLAISCSPSFTREGKSRLMLIMTAGVVMSVAIEMVQVFMPIRVASLTDPIMAAAGCLTGVIGQQHAATFLRYAGSGEVVVPPTAQTRRADLPPADALVASLTEPDPNAPVEPDADEIRVRRRRRRRDRSRR